MRKLGSALVVSLLALGVVPQSGAAQGYEPPEEASWKDVYCSGFVADKSVSTKLRVVMGEDAVGRLIYGENDYVYLGRGRKGGVEVGQRYMLVRRVNDPNPNRAFPGQMFELGDAGHLYQDIGWVEVTAVHKSTATALVTRACDPVNAGDIAIPFQERPIPEYKPYETFDRFAPPSGLAEGKVLLGKDFAHAAGQGDAVYVDVGTKKGVQVGDYFRVFRWAKGAKYLGYKGITRGHWSRYRGVPRGHEIPKVRGDLPREVLGEAIVVHADKKSATAVVTFSWAEMHPGDYVELQPPAPPLAELAVTPPSIPRGGTATLTWKARLADQVELTPAIGTVGRRGTVEVSPSQTTTYTLTATGRGGSAQATATLTVVRPAAPPPPPPPPTPAEATLQELFAQNVQDIFFDFDQAEIRADAEPLLQQAAAFLIAHPELQVVIEGHCDEIGTEEYNMALGARRAEATKNYLVSLGVNAEQLQTVSLGKTQPFCTTSSEEACRQLNRRAHFVLQQ